MPTTRTIIFRRATSPSLRHHALIGFIQADAIHQNQIWVTRLRDRDDRPSKRVHASLIIRTGGKRVVVATATIWLDRISTEVDDKELASVANRKLELATTLLAKSGTLGADRSLTAPSNVFQNLDVGPVVARVESFIRLPIDTWPRKD